MATVFGRYWFPAVLAATLVAIPEGARAGEGPSPEERLAQLTKAEALTIEGKGFIRYWYDIRDGDATTEGDAEPHANTLEIWRFYFGARARLAPWLSMRMTADVGPEKDHETAEAGAAADGTGGHKHEVSGQSSYQLFLKFAWLEAKLAPGLALRAGIVDNPHNDYVDALWGYRFVAKNPGDDFKLWDTADLGAYLRYDLPARFGSVAAGVFNGAGFKNALDTDATKDAIAQAVLMPLAPLGESFERLQLAGFVQAQMTRDSARDRQLTWSGFAGYRDAWFMLGYMAMGRDNDLADGQDFSGIGHAVYARFDTPWKVGAFGRFVRWDADGLARSTADVTPGDGGEGTGSGRSGEAGLAEELDLPAEYEALAGISYSPIKLFSVAASAALTWSEEVKDGEDVEMGVRALLSTEINF
ncbi:MAG: hypothetical protein FJ109_13015 [Deltaproteobacteria bacterium]|nr:hypothetical protein [Deltaproteobacteria bacterium]